MRIVAAVVVAVVIFVVGIAVGGALHDNPRPGLTLTHSRTLTP